MRAYDAGRVDAMWADYVWAVTRGTQDDGDDPTQEQIAVRLLGRIHQTTVGRWLAGSKVPTNAADAAWFAKRYGRNPLEAFVAAGMIEADDAGRGLSAAERAFLKKLAEPGAETARAEAFNSRQRGARQQRRAPDTPRPRRRRG